MSKQIAQLMHKYDIDDEELYGELFEELKQLKQQWQLEALWTVISFISVLTYLTRWCIVTT